MVRILHPEPPPLLLGRRATPQTAQECVECHDYGKCAYCENLLLETFPIEHFLSKSEFREHAFQWENLFPACHDCNSKKGSRSPGKEIIRPDREPDPEDCFDVNVKGQLVANSKIADDAVQTCHPQDASRHRPRRPRCRGQAPL